MRLRRIHSILGVFVLVFWMTALSVQAQLAEQVPEVLEEVGVTEHLNAKLPLDLEFRDEHGNWVELGSFFDGQRPVILTLNYYRCPMLCGLMLNGVVDGLAEMAWTPGAEFEIVTISINPLETPDLAKAKKQNYLKRLERPAAARGWHFMTGRELEIKRLAETLGFSYTYDPVSQEYAHAASIFICTPDGRVARYLDP
jgi:protein SCO1/2